MQFGSYEELLKHIVSTITILPLDGWTPSKCYTNEIFTDTESREKWLNENIEILNNDCEIIIGVNSQKMHSGNFDGVYRFSYTTAYDVTEIKLITPTDIYTLTLDNFRSFLVAIDDWFLEG